MLNNQPLRSPDASAATSSFSPTQMSDKEFNYLRTLIYEHVAIDIKDHKKYLLINRLAKRLRLLGLRSFTDYLRYLETGANRNQEFIELIDAVTTNKTDFYREPKHFEFLETNIFPDLMQRQRNRVPAIYRVWSAASSTGEEPYTISICLSELFSRVPGWDFEVMGSDISETVLRAASAGIYDEERLQPVPKPLLSKYFLKGDNRYKVKPELAKKVSFKKINLKLDFHKSLSGYDLIFCRNVLIYFDKETQQSIVNKCWHVLRPGGFLFLGHSESLHGANTSFRYIAPAVYLKV